jgi:hypothetical protein
VVIILFTGSRDFRNIDVVVGVMMQYDPKTTTVVHGGAPGLDTMVDIIAKELGFTIIRYDADWKDGKRAGLYRNSQMLYETKPDKVIGFRSKLNSRGTNDMLMKAGMAGVDHEIYDDF